MSKVLYFGSVLLLVTLFNLAAGCGVERWAVKVGNDDDAQRVNLLNVKDSTIVYLRSIDAPSDLPNDTRVAPTELTVFELKCTLTAYKYEDDDDYHLVLSDDDGNTMIGEIPDPACVGQASPFKSQISHARDTFDNMYDVSGSFQYVNQSVTVKGVAFFDFIHGQKGVAPNGIELHPILDITFPSSAPRLPRDHKKLPHHHNRGGKDEDDKERANQHSGQPVPKAHRDVVFVGLR
eukprot:TRINITY_DN7862_c0_g1_i1.p1 TRINITY_DN7862_c0_g1~~TRINITY_DN7862_c0_g1_i1.p1  ORF type:complete len:235 (-),score=85.33 TRINITY_DN7862_c0_g1_i1:174-878(-)